MRWRAVLQVTAAAMMVAVLGLPAAPPAHAAMATAQLTVTSTWQTGFIASFAITNYSTVPITDWKLEFDMPPGQSVRHSWSSSVAQYGTRFVVTPVTWTRIIPPGGTVEGGMRGVLSGTYTPPSNCVFNGQVPCS